MTDLACPYEDGCTKWGVATLKLVEQAGGVWPKDGAKQLALCHLVRLDLTGDPWRWVVDDVAGFAKAAGVKVSAAGEIQDTLFTAQTEPTGRQRRA